MKIKIAPSMGSDEGDCGQLWARCIGEKIMEGKAQADRGELLDGPATLAKLKEKYGDRERCIR